MTKDFHVEYGGSVNFIVPLSDAAKEWIDEHIGPDNGYQPYYPERILVEFRYLNPIIEAMLDAGLEIQWP